MALTRANFGFYDAMAQGLLGSQFMSTTEANHRIEIFSGTSPADPDDWLGPGGPGSPAQLLATFSGFEIFHNTLDDLQRVNFNPGVTPNPGTVNATLTGTAAWYAMYNTSTVNSGTGRWLLGDVTLSGGNGSLHLDSLNLISGQPVQLLHWGVRFQA